MTSVSHVQSHAEQMFPPALRTVRGNGVCKVYHAAIASVPCRCISVLFAMVNAAVQATLSAMTAAHVELAMRQSQAEI